MLTLLYNTLFINYEYLKFYSLNKINFISCLRILYAWSLWLTFAFLALPSLLAPVPWTTLIIWWHHNSTHILSKIYKNVKFSISVSWFTLASIDQNSWLLIEYTTKDISFPMWLFVLSNLASDLRLGRLLPCQLPINRIDCIL